jgi:hypothetical protein
VTIIKGVKRSGGYFGSYSKGGNDLNKILEQCFYTLYFMLYCFEKLDVSMTDSLNNQSTTQPIHKS